MFIRQQIQNHGCPAGIAAPAPAKKEGAENFCDGIVNGGRFKNAHEQIIPESLNLHIFIGEKTEVNKHIQPDTELDDKAGMFELSNVEAETETEKTSDICKIEQIENIVQGLP